MFGYYVWVYSCDFQYFHQNIQNIQRLSTFQVLPKSSPRLWSSPRSAQSMKPNPLASLKDRIRPLYLQPPGGCATHGESGGLPPCCNCLPSQWPAGALGLGLHPFGIHLPGRNKIKHRTRSKTRPKLQHRIQIIHHES